MIVVSICKEDLEPHYKKNEKNGKHYTDVVIDTKKEVDKYGKTHAAYISQSKEQRAAKEPKKYVGNGKEFKFNSSSPTPETTSKPQSNSNDEPFDDLPF